MQIHAVSRKKYNKSQRGKVNKLIGSVHKWNWVWDTLLYQKRKKKVFYLLAKKKKLLTHCGLVGIIFFLLIMIALWRDFEEWAEKEKSFSLFDFFNFLEKVVGNFAKSQHPLEFFFDWNSMFVWLNNLEIIKNLKKKKIPWKLS